jgi:plastocyanin domain-containing protein
MENVKLVFVGSDNETELTLFANKNNDIYIDIDMGGYPPSFIAINKQTAIKLSKELRKQISYLED